MPDDTTQIRATIYSAKYPAASAVLSRSWPNAALINKEHLLEMIEQAMVMGQRERTPVLKVIIGNQEIAVMMEDQEMGLLGNVLEIGGQATHERFMIGFTPDNLVAALRASPNTDFTFWYAFDVPDKPVKIDGGSGYEVVLMPRSLERSADD